MARNLNSNTLVESLQLASVGACVAVTEGSNSPFCIIPRRANTKTTRCTKNREYYCTTLGSKNVGDGC